MRHNSLERSLSEQIQGLYLTCLGHKTARVSCELREQMLVVTVEDPITRMERVLMANDKQQLAEEARAGINQAFKPQLKALIEKVLNVSVIDILGDSNIHTGRTIVNAILAAPPDGDNMPSTLQFKQQKVPDINNE